MLTYLQVDETTWNNQVSAWQQVKDAQNTPGAPVPAHDHYLYQEWLVGNYQTGHWKQQGNLVVVNVIGDSVDELVALLGVGNTGQRWYWDFNGNVDFDTEYTGQHDDLLALQEDRILYDVDGNPIGTEPASFENPNWAQGYAGQGLNQFARSVTREFGEDYN